MSGVWGAERGEAGIAEWVPRLIWNSCGLKQDPGGTRSSLSVKTSAYSFDLRCEDPGIRT